MIVEITVTKRIATNTRPVRHLTSLHAKVENAFIPGIDVMEKMTVGMDPMKKIAVRISCSIAQYSSAKIATSIFETAAVFL